MESLLQSAVRATVGIAVLRFLPFVGYALASRRLGLRFKTASLAAYTVTVALFFQLDHKPWLLVVLMVTGYAYFLVLAVATCGIARIPVAARSPSWLLFGLFFFLHVTVPCALVRSPHSLVLQVVGWEMTFSAFSLVEEARRRGVAPSLGDAVLFLVVNPAIVYARRGELTAVPAEGRAGGSRIALGLGALFLSSLLKELSHNGRAASIMPGGDLHAAGGYAGLLAEAALIILATYTVLSGLASVQIGWMRCLGWRIPERYRHPYLAVSFADFWRRWNTYHREWLERYVFYPIALGPLRKMGVGPAKVLGLVAVFAFIGAAHDMISVTPPWRTPAPTATTFFLLNSLAMIGELAVVRGVRAVVKGPMPRTLAVAGRVLFVHSWCAIVWTTLVLTR